jgi:hypothetical protein
MFRTLSKTFSRASQKNVFVKRAYSSSLKYTPDHEWLSIKGDVGIFGITDYAQKGILADFITIQ